MYAIFIGKGLVSEAGFSFSWQEGGVYSSLKKQSLKHLKYLRDSGSPRAVSAASPIPSLAGPWGTGRRFTLHFGLSHPGSLRPLSSPSFPLTNGTTPGAPALGAFVQRLRGGRLQAAKGPRLLGLLKQEDATFPPSKKHLSPADTHPQPSLPL